MRMWMWMRIRHGKALFLGLLTLTPGLPAQEPQEARVLQGIANFDTGDGAGIGPVTFWRWTEEEKQAAATFSQLELAAAPGEAAAAGRALKVTVPKGFPRTLDYYPLWSTGLEYLPPETEGLRLRVRVAAGRFTLSVGSPTTYFANSDVRAEPQVLEAGDGWRTVEFSLVSGLHRNYRRPIFSAESPVIHYTRWIQEPMRLLISADSQGELWIDDIELVTRGKGRPFPEFAPEAMRVLGGADLGAAFTFATDDREFDLSHTPGQKALRQPALLRALTGERGRLEARQRGLEEMSFIGVPARCPEGVNAFHLALKIDHAEPLEELVVDVLALVAPGGVFPWEKTRPPSDTPAREAATKGFDYCLSPRRTAGLSWGFYHTRRAVRRGEWSSVTLPFADFVCAYGVGELRDRHQKQQPLQAGEVVAVALVSPFRQRRSDTVFTLEKIDLVVLAGDPAAWISYPQVRDLTRVRLESTTGQYGRQARQVDLP